jgi:hypothetical protein
MTKSTLAAAIDMRVALSSDFSRQALVQFATSPCGLSTGASAAWSGAGRATRDSGDACMS